MSFPGYGYGGGYNRYGSEPELAIQAPSMLAAVGAAESLEKSELSTAEAQRQFQQESQLAPLKMQAAKEQAAAQSQAYYHQSIGQIAKDTMALDPDQRANYWDEQMGKQADAGNPLAGQYKGHYRPDLASNVADVYAGPAQGAPRSRSGAAASTSGFDVAAFNRALDNQPPEQLPKMLQNQNAVIDGFNRVHDEQSWNDELANMRQMGIPVDKLFNPNVDWRVNYATAARMLNDRIVPMRDTIAARVMAQSTGVPVPATPPLYKPEYRVSPFVAPGGRPVAIEATSGQWSEGPAGATKPSAGATTFQAKYDLGLQVFGGDQKQAALYAQGKIPIPKNTDPAQVQEWANNQALRELGGLEATGQDTTITDKQAWLAQRSKAYFDSMMNAPARQGGGGGGGGGPIVLPQRAVGTVKAAGGKPVRFNNGTVWKWQNGKAVRVS